MSLRIYNRKRDFKQTPEPKGQVHRTKGPLRFVVQMHEASRLHFDFRLEFGGVFKSWAVPKGPSLNPLDQRLAVFVEDHPLEYGSFEGIIPKGNYGAGTVMVWDEGTYVERGSETRSQSEAAMKKNFEKGHITFVLDGKKLKGEFALIKLKKSSDEKAWLLVKKRDEHSTYKMSQKPNNLSIKTGRSIEEIAEESAAAGKIWLPKKSKQNAKALKTPSPRKVKTAPQTIQEKKIKKTLSSDPIPRKNKPMLPIHHRGAAPEGNFIFEKSGGGLRALAEVQGKRVHLYSRSGLSFEKKFPEIVDELKKLDLEAVFDGEIIKNKNKNIYSVFDLLYTNGKDLRHEPLSNRLKNLRKLFRESSCLQLSETISAKYKGPILARDLESPYKSGTSSEWLILEGHQMSTNPQASKKENDKKGSVTNEGARLTNLDKIFWPDEGYTKGDLINYYKKISPYIIPFLKDRPESLNRLPNGIAAPGFYQKDMTGYIPRWLKTTRIFSESADKSIDYVLCQDERSLLYIVNLGCIEINPWFSRVGHLESPDFMAIDLDPDGNDFDHVIEIAHEVREVLQKIGAESFCKTSGATGIHIGVPTGAKYSFDEVRELAEMVCRWVAKKFPATTSVDRNPQRRKGKIYLDFLQNRRGQTLAAPFCVRPRPGAPVSMPLTWKELRPGLKPEHFNIKNAPQLIPQAKSWHKVLEKGIDLQKCLKNLRKFYSVENP